MNRTSPIFGTPAVKGWRIGRCATVLALAGVALAAIYTGGTDAFAQKAKKKAPVKVETPAQTEAKETVAFKFPGKIVLPGKADHRTLAKTIDQLIDAELKEYEVTASPLCTDEEFIRRVYLDLVGVIPTAAVVKDFLDSKEADNRARLVDELLGNPRYGKFQGELWAKQLMNNESVNRRLSEAAMLTWLSERFSANQPWDKLVYDFVTATGPQDKNGAVTFFISNAAPEKMTDLVTQNFMGVQLQCAQCHNHPFTDYKQEEYWGMAAFFLNVSISGNPNQAAKNGTPISVDENTGKAKKGKKLKLPPEAKKVGPSFLQDNTQPKLDKTQPYRPVLAAWMTSRDNPYFARAAANKMWFHFFGRGIVNPHDDMHPDNPPSHADLLATLADQFKQNDFDLKYLVRAICTSKTYQRSSKPAGNNADDQELFSHALVRSLHPEQLYDSLAQVMGTEPQVNAAQKGLKRQPANPRQKFIDFFTGDDGYKPLEFQAGIPQALLLMNAKQFSNNNKVINQAIKQAKNPKAVIEHLFLSTYSRAPSAAELQTMTAFVQKQASPQQAYGDILWALVNSSEFALNH